MGDSPASMGQEVLIDNVNHLHFGANSSGLGHLIPMIKSNLGSNVRTTLATKSQLLDESVSKSIQAIRDTGQLQVLEYDDKRPIPIEAKTLSNLNLLYYDTEYDKIVEFITVPSTCVITISVFSALSTIARIIAKGLINRNVGPSKPKALFVLTSANYPFLKDELQDGIKNALKEYDVDDDSILETVEFLDILNERICIDPLQLFPDSLPTITVEKRAYLKIVSPGSSSEGKRTIEFRKRLNLMDNISYPESEFRKIRARWLRDEMLVVLSVIAAQEEISSLQEVLRNPTLKARLDGLVTGFAQAVCVYCGDLGLRASEADLNIYALKNFAEQQFQRLLKLPAISPDIYLAERLEWDGEPQEVFLFLKKTIFQTVEPINVLVNPTYNVKKPEPEVYYEVLRYVLYMLELVKSRTACMYKLK